MIKREEYRFCIGIYTDELHSDALELVQFLRDHVHGSEVELEGCKSDFSILTVKMEIEKP